MCHAGRRRVRRVLVACRQRHAWGGRHGALGARGGPSSRGAVCCAPTSLLSPAALAVRGYGVGELSACRRFVEGAAEVRYPVRKGKDVFAFVEAGTDLGSSAELRGDPTEYYRRAGSGSSLGAGVKLGGLRVEAVRDNNAAQWNLMVQYGERF